MRRLNTMKGGWNDRSLKKKPYNLFLLGIFVFAKIFRKNGFLITIVFTGPIMVDFFVLVVVAVDITKCHRLLHENMIQIQIQIQ